MGAHRFLGLANGLAADSEMAMSFSLELIARWRSHKKPDTSEVLSAYPGLARCKRAVVDLAYEEYCLRIEAGEDLDWVDFCQRFPEVEDSLQRRIAVHLALGDGTEFQTEEKETAWPRVGKDFAGYEIIGEIGRGSFARVYQANEIALGGRPVVIKVCQQASNEAQTLGKLTHRNIIPVHSVQEIDSGLMILCMPFLGMFTLADLLETTYGFHVSKVGRLKALGAIPGVADQSLERLEGRSQADGYSKVAHVNYALETGIQLCEALQYLHDQGILHLDLKPSNILVDQEKKPIVLDFNLSLDRSGIECRTGGTLCYMSPEQRQVVFSRNGNVRLLDVRTDVFSIGVILFELFNGRLPFDNDQMKESTLAGDPSVRYPWNDKNPLLSNGIKRVVDQCLEEDPDRRFSSAAEVAVALRSQQTWFRRSCRRFRGDRGFKRMVVYSSALVGTAMAYIIYAVELYRIFP